MTLLLAFINVPFCALNIAIYADDQSNVINLVAACISAAAFVAILAMGYGARRY